jgi:3-oxoadipate enol-lactonase
MDSYRKIASYTMARIRVDDLQIGYNERGAGDALLFLHGVGSDKSVWDRQLAYFAPRWRAVALDYPGYGETELPERELQRADIAAYVFGALDALGIGAAHVVGLSMGGVIALEMALQAPARLRSLVLADTFAWHPDSAAIMERMRGALASLTMRAFAEQRVDVLLGPGAAPELRAEVIETMARIDKRAYAWASAAVWTPDYRAELARIALPALVLVGEHDRPTPPALSEALQAGLPNARLQIIAGAGHIANIDRPAAFNRAVEDFLA